jgi:type IV pilus assembly protein PilV
MIEVLVSMVVVSVGLIGMAGLQAASLRTTSESGHRGAAARLADDMADRLRQDPASIARYVAKGVVDLTAQAGTDCYTATGCQGDTRVLSQLADWQRELAAQLPGGEGVVCRDATPFDGDSFAAPACSGGANDPVVIKVWWRSRLSERSTGSGAVSLRHSIVFGV